MRRRRFNPMWSERIAVRHEFVLRPARRPGSICEDVEANSIRLAREARAAERTWRREHRNASARFA